MLKDCHEKMDGSKAVGIDGMTKEEYSRNLEENLERLVERLKKIIPGVHPLLFPWEEW